MSKKIDKQLNDEIENNGIEGVEIQTSNEEAAAAPKKKKSAKSVINTIINVVLVIAIVIAAFCTYISFVSTSGSGVPSIFGIEMFSIKTESMHPTLEPGDLIFDTRVKDMSSLKIGDIITYWTVIDGERVLNTHRIYEIYDGGNYLIFSTKGDKNNVQDALTVHESEVVGQYKGARIKGAGKVFEFLQTSKGFLIVVVIPVAIFFIFHLVQFFRVLFEYQNVKQRLIYEQERGRNEDALDEEKENIKKEEREKLEAELREKLKAEIKASGGATEENPADAVPPAKTEAEIRAELEAKIRAEYEAKAKAEAAKDDETVKLSDDKKD